MKKMDLVQKYKLHMHSINVRSTFYFKKEDHLNDSFITQVKGYEQVNCVWHETDHGYNVP